MNKDSFTHAPSHLREQFQEWLDSYEPDRLREIDIRPVSALLDALAECGDTLPADYCDQLEILKGSTYAQAVEDVRQWYAMCRQVKEPFADGEGHDPQKGVWTDTGVPEAFTTTRRYAVVAWCIDDITSRYDASPEQAHSLLADIEKWLEEAMVMQGWDAIDDAARERGIKANPENEWDI